MIVLITDASHSYTLKSITNSTFGVAVPKLRIVSYRTLLGARRVPRATYIFTDFERLAQWELVHAANLYRRFKAAGLRCLNDPAKAMARVELLANLKQSLGNPVGAYRADELPRPEKFPVFLRSESDHLTPSSRLYHSQDELDEALRDAQAAGTPLRGLLVIEQVSEPYDDGIWAKWGTWRIGDQIIVEHIAVDAHWLVKYGDHAKVTERVTFDELSAVRGNSFAAETLPAFEIAHIEYGRADHAICGGRTVIYEINTNPKIGRYVPDRWPMRREAQLLARTKISGALDAIDEKKSGSVRIDGPAEPWWRFWSGHRTMNRP